MNNYYGDLMNDKAYFMALDQQGVDIHTHDYFEMVYIAEGGIYHYFQNRRIEVKEGNFFIINISDEHGYETIPGKKCHLYNFLFYPEFIDPSMIKCRNFSALIESYLIKFDQSILKFNPTTYLFSDENKEIKGLFEKLKTEEENRSQGYTEVMRCTFIEILIKTMRKIINEERAVIKNSPTRFLINHIEKNYASKVSLCELSKILNYSLPYISSRFKKETGFLFTEYLQKYRVDQASRLISNTDKKISEIASMVGYEDTKFFVEVFKKYMHTTPAGFRKHRI